VPKQIFKNTKQDVTEDYEELDTGTLCLTDTPQDEWTNGTGRTSAICRRNDNIHTKLSQNTKEEITCDLRVDGREVSLWVLEIYGLKMWIGFNQLAMGYNGSDSRRSRS
jgi:hypothetical protein